MAPEPPRKCKEPPATPAAVMALRDERGPFRTSCVAVSVAQLAMPVNRPSWARYGIFPIGRPRLDRSLPAIIVWGRICQPPEPSALRRPPTCASPQEHDGPEPVNPDPRRWCHGHLAVHDPRPDGAAVLRGAQPHPSRRRRRDPHRLLAGRRTADQDQLVRCQPHPAGRLRPGGPSARLQPGRRTPRPASRRVQRAHGVRPRKPRAARCTPGALWPARPAPRRRGNRRTGRGAVLRRRRRAAVRDPPRSGRAAPGAAHRPGTDLDPDLHQPDLHARRSHAER